MSATIVGDSIPFLQRGPGETPSEPTCSVSLDSGMVPSEEFCTGSNVSVSTLRSHGAKVDYVPAIDLPKTAPLRKTITEPVNRGNGSPHVNQTAYLPLKESPIAVSIEVKVQVGAEDPMVQLGI